PPRLGGIVVCVFHAAYKLVVFVSFAREQYDIAAKRALHRVAYRPAPIGDNRKLVLHALHAVENVVDDALRILAARVVGGDDHTIGEARGDPAHFGTLAAVALATAAEDAGQFRVSSCKFRVPTMRFPVTRLEARNSQLGTPE